MRKADLPAPVSKRLEGYLDKILNNANDIGECRLFLADRERIETITTYTEKIRKLFK